MIYLFEAERNIYSMFSKQCFIWNFDVNYFENFFTFLNLFSFNNLNKKLINGEEGLSLKKVNMKCKNY